MASAPPFLKVVRLRMSDLPPGRLSGSWVHHKPWGTGGRVWTGPVVWLKMEGPPGKVGEWPLELRAKPACQAAGKAPSPLAQGLRVLPAPSKQNGPDRKDQPGPAWFQPGSLGQGPGQAAQGDKWGWVLRFDLFAFILVKYTEHKSYHFSLF